MASSMSLGTVMREPSLEFGAERVLMRIPQSSGVFVRFMVAARDLSHVALVLGSSMGAPISTLVVWREGQEVARYENLVAAEGGSVSGIAFTADGSSVLAITGGRLTRYPVTQGAPTSAAIDIGFEAFQSLGGARHLPVSGSALLLHQYPHGALGLFTEEGAPLFVHSAPQAYCTRELRRSVASLAPSGRWIVAAVGAPDALDGKKRGPESSARPPWARASGVAISAQSSRCQSDRWADVWTRRRERSEEREQSESHAWGRGSGRPRSCSAPTAVRDAERGASASRRRRGSFIGRAPG
jgi:hypothetical protein